MQATAKFFRGVRTHAHICTLWDPGMWISRGQLDTKLLKIQDHTEVLCNSPQYLLFYKVTLTSKSQLLAISVSTNKSIQHIFRALMGCNKIQKKFFLLEIRATMKLRPFQLQVKPIAVPFLHPLRTLIFGFNLDMSKEFAGIWHDALVFKLIAYGVEKESLLLNNRWMNNCSKRSDAGYSMLGRAPLLLFFACFSYDISRKHLCSFKSLSKQALRGSEE